MIVQEGPKWAPPPCSVKTENERADTRNQDLLLSLKVLENNFDQAKREILYILNTCTANGLWLHFGTDVLHDEEYPAVNYRTPGGLRFHACEQFMRICMAFSKAKGISVAIYSPCMDGYGLFGNHLATRLNNIFA